jgi:hypothetical protein
MSEKTLPGIFAAIPSLSNGRRIRSRYGRSIGAPYFSFVEKEGVLSVHMTQD